MGNHGSYSDWSAMCSDEVEYGSCRALSIRPRPEVPESPREALDTFFLAVVAWAAFFAVSFNSARALAIL